MPEFEFDLAEFVKALGYAGLFIVIFAESGVFIGFFLPGDSLLFTAGFLASQGLFDITLLVTLAFAGAVLGDSFGYAFGYRVGPLIFKREDSFFFHKKHIERAEHFYEKHGAKAIILARFMPFVRTYAPILAGVGKMRYGKFLFYNVAGGLLWAVGMPLLGFLLGNSIPGIDRYLVPIILFIIATSFLPALVQIARGKGFRERLKWRVKKQ